MADTARAATYTVTADGIGAVPVTVTERGEGRPFLLLHGGAGPQSVDGFAALLASSGPAGCSPRCTRDSAGLPARRAWPACRAWRGSMSSCSPTSG